MVSLPSRERGLKYDMDELEYVETKSLPSRERGLKYLCFLCVKSCFCRSLRGSVD